MNLPGVWFLLHGNSRHPITEKRKSKFQRSNVRCDGNFGSTETATKSQGAVKRVKVWQERGLGKLYRFYRVTARGLQKNDSPGGFGGERFIRRMHGHKSWRSVSTTIPLHPFDSCVKWRWNDRCEWRSVRMPESRLPVSRGISVFPVTRAKMQFRSWWQSSPAGARTHGWTNAQTHTHAHIYTDIYTHAYRRIYIYTGEQIPAGERAGLDKGARLRSAARA